LKLLVVGASGRTGRRVTDQAIARGHEVTSLVRRREAIGAADHLRVVAGDPRRADALAPSLAGQDAVISCLGPRSRDDAHLQEQAAAAMLAAMRGAGVRRYLVVSQGLLFPNRNPLIALLRLIFARTVADSTAMERLVRASDADWTILRAPRLLEGGVPRGYRIEVGARPRGAVAMQRADLAACLLDEAERPAHIKQILGVTSARGR
jgi:putative NADH-flavin reductase